MTVEDLIKSYLSIWLSDFQDRMNNAGIAVPHVHWPFVSWWYRYSETLPVEHASVQTPEICIAFLFSLQDGRAAVIFCSSLLNLESACNSDLRHSLSMKIDCDLLRGVSLATSLSAWGRHWSSSGGTSMCFGFQGESAKQAWLYDTASPDMQCQTRQFNYWGREYRKGERGELCSYQILEVLKIALWFDRQSFDQPGSPQDRAISTALPSAWRVKTVWAIECIPRHSQANSKMFFQSLFTLDFYATYVDMLNH